MSDKHEKAILAALQKNARISVSELARDLGISRATVQTKINRLEYTGTIKRYSVELGEDYEQKLVTSLVMIKCSQKLTGQVNKKLMAFPWIYEVNSVSGDYDMVALVKSETLKELNRSLDLLVNLAGIERTNSAIVLENMFRR